MTAFPGLSQLIGAKARPTSPKGRNSRQRNEEGQREWVRKHPESREAYQKQLWAEQRAADDDDDDEYDLEELANRPVQNRRRRNIGAKASTISPKGRTKRERNEDKRKLWFKKHPDHAITDAKRWINEKIRNHRATEAAAREAKRTAKREDSSDSEDELLDFDPFARQRRSS